MEANVSPPPDSSDGVDQAGVAGTEANLNPTPYTAVKSHGLASTAKRARKDANADSKTFTFSWERVPIEGDEDEVPQSRWGAASCLIEDNSKVNHNFHPPPFLHPFENPEEEHRA